MRLFVAIELTDDARAAIAAEQNRVCTALGGADSLKLVKPEHLHVTLAFIGDASDDRAAAITTAMSTDFSEAPFRMSFGGVGVFPPRGAPSVLWLGIVSGAQQAVRLHDLVAARLAATGAPLERRPFHPHLTVGRWREVPRRSDRPLTGSDIRALAGPGQADGAVATVDVRSVTLFQSRLSPSGPTHIARAQGYLRRAGDEPVH
jgi:2'-5' RNA ligase